MSTIFIRTLLTAFVLALSLGAASCGGDDASDEDPQTILEETFDAEESIASGTLDVSLSASAEGRRGGSVEATLSGPFQGDPEDPTAVPELDLDVAASGDGFGERIDFEQGVTITDDNAYLEVRGQAYELGSERFGQIREAIGAQEDSAEPGEESSTSITELCAQALEQAGLDTAACEIDPTTWLTNVANEGTEEVGGAETVHISGDADIEQILTDVGELISGFAGGVLQGFDPAALGTFSDLVSQASIDVYSGVDDRLLRGLGADVVIDLSVISGLGVSVPFDTIDLSLSAEIEGVNEEQTIEPPADPRPYEDLPRGYGPDLDLDLFGSGKR